MKLIMEDDDYQEIVDEMQGNLDAVPTREQIDKILEGDDGRTLIGKAAAWGWSDTEVREDLVEAFEELGLG